MPNGALQTEWIETKENINKSSRLLQEEIFNRFVDDADTALLFLGFCDKNVTLSPSLEYWRNFAGLFTRQLSRTPELEPYHRSGKRHGPLQQLRKIREPTDSAPKRDLFRTKPSFGCPFQSNYTRRRKGRTIRKHRYDRFQKGLGIPDCKERIYACSWTLTQE